MTRRERHERILQWFSERSVNWAKGELEARHGLSLWTDEAIEKLARRCLENYRRQQRMNEENRKRAKVRA